MLGLGERQRGEVEGFGGEEEGAEGGEERGALCEAEFVGAGF